VVYVAADMKGPGHVKHTGRGDLIVGDLKGSRQSEVNNLAAVFHRAQIPCDVSDDIEADLWTKLSLNCAHNAVSALLRAKYGGIVKHAHAREVLRLAVEETAAVAQAAHIRVAAANLVEAAFRLADAMPEATSSTAQDLRRGKRTEIDALNGFVVRRGAELG